jgi:hypothetical protein
VALATVRRFSFTSAASRWEASEMNEIPHSGRSEDTAKLAESAALSGVRRRRAELHGTIVDVEGALASPARGREELWGIRVRDALAALITDFAEHVRTTEGPEGLHQEIVSADPRLVNAVQKLTDDHQVIAADLAEVSVLARSTLSAEEVDLVRTKTTRLLAILIRHRQRGADLVYEALATDLGASE